MGFFLVADEPFWLGGSALTAGFLFRGLDLKTRSSSTFTLELAFCGVFLGVLGVTCVDFVPVPLEAK